MIKIPQRSLLSVFALVMINVIAVDSIRTLPMAASYGFALVSLYAFGALTFFIPTALITAELATTWPNRGGMYYWVKLAFGPKWGLCVVYLQWIYNVVWYPAILTLIASTFAYLVAPQLLDNKAFMVSMVLMIFWSCTLINFFGMRISSLVSTFGSLVGTLGPMVIMTLFAFIWIKQGNQSQITMSWNHFLPKIKSLSELVFFSQLIYSLLGLEMSAVHAMEVNNPQKDYPKALLISVFIILLSLIFASLAIAIVVPKETLSNLTGIMQAFTSFTAAFHISVLNPYIALAIIIGGICAVSTWIIGPTKGLFAASDDNLLPLALTRLNRHQVPTNLLLAQGVIGSLLTLTYVLFTIESAYILLSIMAAQLSLLMYSILFASAIKLRYNQAHVARVFTIPGSYKNWGMWLCAGTGLLLSISVVLLGFIPPDDKSDLHAIFLHELFLIGGMGIILAPLLLIKSKKISRAL